ncbi:hypothetical protein ACM66B_003793 [Microbotryomycetes sp. NB124-2]
MQFEWEQPPQASSFAADGQPARKRTHYEAMDVDTPPRVSFPSAATATDDPFRFTDKRQSGQRSVETQQDTGGDMSFSAEEFDAPNAFGLPSEAGNAKEGSRDDDKENEKVADRALTVLDGNGVRRRRSAAATTKSKSAAPARQVATDREEADAFDGEDEGIMVGGKKLKGSEFSFQVHHHHAPQHAAQTKTEHVLDGDAPYVLLGYLQFGALAVLALLVLSISLLFLYTLYADIQARLAALTVELRAEILQCAKAYVDNRCEPATRIPAMEKRCSGWEECMGREAVVVGKTRVVAETIAEVVNSFVDVISWKTMLFVLLSLGLCIYGSSVALALLPSRTKHDSTRFPSHPSFHSAPPYGALPPTAYPHQWYAGPPPISGRGHTDDSQHDHGRPRALA